MADEAQRDMGKVIREWGQFAIVLFATISAFYQFIYKERIVPSRRPPVLTIQATLEAVGRKGPLVLVRARVRVANQSDVKVWVPALWYNIVAYRAGDETLSDSTFAPFVRQMIANKGEAASRYSPPASMQVVAVWHLSTTYFWYQPKDESTNETLFYVPADRFDAVMMQAQMVMTKNGGAIDSLEFATQSSGEIEPKLLVPGSKGGKTEALDDQNPRHRRWAEENGVAHNSTVATLSLLPAAK